MKEEYAIQAELISYLLNSNNQEAIALYLEQSNYFWLGHSLGCKYISLLEILSNNSQNINKNLIRCQFNPEELQIIEADIKTLESERISHNNHINSLLKQKRITKKIFTKKSIIDQPAIFLAPEIYGTQDRQGSTIPYFRIFPSGDKTLCLIAKNDNLFNN